MKAYVAQPGRLLYRRMPSGRRSSSYGAIASSSSALQNGTFGLDCLSPAKCVQNEYILSTKWAGGRSFPARQLPDRKMNISSTKMNTPGGGGVFIFRKHERRFAGVRFSSAGRSGLAQFSPLPPVSGLGPKSSKSANSPICYRSDHAVPGTYDKSKSAYADFGLPQRRLWRVVFSPSTLVARLSTALTI